MTKISITIETQGLDALQANNLATFLNSLESPNSFLDRAECPEPAIEDEQIEKPKATRNRAKKVEAPIEENKAENVEVVEPGEVTNSAPQTQESYIESQKEADDLIGEEVPAITIEQIRSIVSEKQADHKESIRNKLKEFDAANVTALPKENYVAFYTFLKGL
jgi:hypothetical protein